jgi:hypothetical protein
MLLMALAVILQAGPTSAGELKIYSSEGVKKIEKPGAPAEDSLLFYRYAGERCLSNCEAAPAAAETVAPHEKKAGERPIPRPRTSASKRSCST